MLAVFPGSFDPFTNGHLDVAHRALSLFGTLSIAILDNKSKQHLFTCSQRVEMIRQLFIDDQKRVSVDSFSGLLVDYLALKKTHLVVRGLRATTDYEYETQMALMNRHLSPQVETVFLVAREEHGYISSTIVKQVAALNGDVSKLVPEHINLCLRATILKTM